MNKIQSLFDGDVKKETVVSWLNQFEEEERPIINKLLTHFKYYSPKKVDKLVHVLHNNITNFLGMTSEKIRFVPVGYVAKSGGVVAYFYKNRNNLKASQFISTEDFRNLKTGKDSAIVFIDDFIGSGHQAAALWREIIAPIVSHEKQSNIIFAALVGYENGIEYLHKNTEFKIIVADKVLSSESPFAEDSRIFEITEERVHARNILQKYGKHLFPDHPFGYASSELLVGFFYSTPTNTLPVFWSYKADWKPLLPRGETYIDPENLITHDYDLKNGTFLTSQKRVIQENIQLDKYRFSSEVAVKIFNEFRLSSIFLVLAPILDELNIKENVLSRLIDLIDRLKYRERDNKSICTSILIIPEGKSDNSAFQRVILSCPGNILNSLDAVVSSSTIVSGYVGSFVLKSNGELVGSLIFKEDSPEVESFLPEKYLKPATASALTNGLLLLFDGNGRIKMFFKGKRILSHQRATWHIHPCDIKKGINFIAEKHSVDSDILSFLLKQAYKISDEGKGTFITVGDHENILKYADLSKSFVKCKEEYIKKYSSDFLLQLFSRKGAAIIDNIGNIKQGMTFLRPPEIKDPEIEISKASRYNIAAKMSYLTNAVCLVVELDGKITIYSKGKIAFRIMG
ncbi:hypothetical protein ACFL4T_00395 [candidate division KSB1 bacterium]